MNTRRLIPVRPPTWPRLVRALVVAATSLAVGDGCMVGPNYKRPATPMPAAYREATTAPATAPTTRADHRAVPRHDGRAGRDQVVAAVRRPEADRLGRAIGEGQLQRRDRRGAASARRRAARQVVQSLLYPTVGVGAFGPAVPLQRVGDQLPGRGHLEDNLFTVGFDAAWVVDVFGGTRRGVEAARANEQAAAADRRGRRA